MYLSSLRELALGSRLKALSDQFYTAVDEVYRACGAGIESRWFPVMRYLRDVGPTTVTDMALAIGQTHSAVSQLADRLVEAGMVVRRRDPHDGRRSVLALTDAGERALGALGPVWLAIRRGMAESLGPHGMTMLAAIDDCEQALRERPLVAAVIYNRLHARMPLGIDATIRYGLHIQPTEAIKESQLRSSSPYNTRNRLGLPPTPIGNPGLASMQAAAHPAKVNYLYFVRKPDKVHHFFTASFAAFQAYASAHGF